MMGITRSRKAQATAELAVFGSLIILVVGALLSYTRTIREQQLMEQNVFRQALYDAYNHTFNATDMNDNNVTDYGATVSFSNTTDKQAGLLFEPARRSYSSSYAVFWSGAEDPPELNEMNVNKDSVSLSKKKITCFRSSDATETPDKELKMSTLDLIMTIAPSVLSALLTNKSVQNLLDIGSWGDTIAFIIRLAQFGYFTAEYYSKLDDLEAVEARRASLEDQDEQYSRWGWRVSTEAKDSADGIEAGKYYVKEIDAQVYDTSMSSGTTNNYAENKREDSSQITNMRTATVSDTVNRNYKLRYDITSPDPTVDLSSHTYEYLSDVGLSQGLGSDSSYSSSQVGTAVMQEQTWVTPH